MDFFGPCMEEEDAGLRTDAIDDVVVFAVAVPGHKNEQARRAKY